MDIDSTQHQIYTEREGIHSGSILYTAPDIHREGGNTLRFYTLHSTRYTQGGKEYTPVLYSTQHQIYTRREGIHSGSILYTVWD